MPEPAIGRIGYVLNGLGAGLDDPERPRGRQIRCNGCRAWFPADNAACPDCEHVRPGFNVGIRAAQLNSALHAQAAEAAKPPRERAEFRDGYRNVLKQARKQVAKHGVRAFIRT